MAAHQIHTVQLFQNLIGNAIRYRSDARPDVKIWHEPVDSMRIVHVRDNGVGIPPEFAAEIFQPFKRLHGHDVPGSGIGLATCQRIVGGYGGRIWVDSQTGHGSTFHFTLPPA